MAKRHMDSQPGILPDGDYRELLEQYAEKDQRGLMVIGPGRRVRTMNPAARMMLGFSGNLPLSVGEVVRDPEFGFAVGDAFHDRRQVTYELYVPDPDRLLRFQLLPILTETGEPGALVASLEDITRLRHLETVRRDFVANVSHELRTPIASINLLVETLQRGALQDPEAADHFLRRIGVETQAMARLVEELLELSRLETGVLHLTLESVDVKRMLEDVCNRLAPSAVEKDIRIDVDVQPDVPAVSADPKRLEQVLMNLVHNAIKFTPDGGTVTLRAARHGRGLRIDIIDTGVGMDSTQAARVFERFYKVDKGRNRTGGSGLGLAIARHLLELHGAQLSVVSEPGRGSRFSFALPLA